MSATSLHLNTSLHSKYMESLKVFATLRESLDLADKVVLAGAITLLDPYFNTTTESRERVLSQYPIHTSGQLKRAMLFSMTNVGYSDIADRKLMQNVSYVQYKPLEPHLHQNNQAQVAMQDEQIVPGMIVGESGAGTEPLYEDGQVLGARAEIFSAAQAAFDSEIDLYAAAFESVKATPHILSPLLSHGYVLYCPTPYLQAAKSTGHLTHDEIVTFIDKQMKLIESEIKGSLARMNKSERDRTKMCRDFLTAYATFKRNFLEIDDGHTNLEIA